MDNLDINIKSFIGERLVENHRQLSKDNTFKSLIRNLSDCSFEIKNNFNAELFEKYKDIQSQIHYQELQNAYKLGIKDSINIFYKETKM